MLIFWATMKNTTKIMCFIILALFVNGAQEKMRTSLEQNKPLWDGKRVQINRVLKIGVDDLESDAIFGYISDVFVSDNGSIYILDYRNSKAFQYSADGKHLRTYGNGSGQGPGEFVKAMHIYVDGEQNVYIADNGPKKISIFNNAGELINTSRDRINVSITGFFVNEKKEIYIAANPLYLSAAQKKKGIVSVYSLPEWNNERCFGIPDTIQKKVISIGANSMVYDRERGSVIVSYASSYQIEEYSNSSTILRKYSRNTSEFHETIKIEDVKYTMGSSYRIGIVENDMVANLVRCIRVKNDKSQEILNYIDVFNREGEYLISIPGEEFGGKGREIRGMCTDKKGYIYLVYEDPYPCVEKYKLNISDH